GELPLGMDHATPDIGTEVQRLVGLYADRVPGRPSKALLGAVGKAVKRLLTTDGFPVDDVERAVAAAAPHARRDIDRFVAAPTSATPALTRRAERKAMFDAWERKYQAGDAS
ncbi:MAG: hypothetical protein P8099_21380, partial [Gemmatimonadota bacterium]